MSCEELAEALSAYADGELEGAERVQLELHLAQCDACREQLEGYRQVTRQLQSLGDVQPTVSLRTSVQASISDQHRSGSGWGLLPRLTVGVALAGVMIVLAAALSRMPGLEQISQLAAQPTPPEAVVRTAPSKTPEVRQTPSATKVPSMVEQMVIRVYFNNGKLAAEPETCRVVHPLERVVPKTPAVARAALEQLFVGPTTEEQALGYTSPFSARTKSILRSVNIRDGTAYVNLADIRQIIPNASTACGSAQFFAETEATLKQFSTIQRVVYAIDGRPTTFYEWMQIGCDDAIGNCDEAPFRPVTAIRRGTTLSVEPVVGEPGSIVSFSGSGFTPRGAVSVLAVEGLGLIIADVEADQEGKISGSFRVPVPGEVAGVPFGRIAVFAIDEASRERSPNVMFAIRPRDSSARSSRLLYLQNADGGVELRSINPDGSDDRLMFRSTESLMDFAISPDGQQIAYVRVPWSTQPDGRPSELWVTDQDGDNARLVYEPPASHTVLHDTAWTPDGSGILVYQIVNTSKEEKAVQTSSRESVLRIDLASGAAEVVATDCGQPAFLPNGWLLTVGGYSSRLSISRLDGTEPIEVRPEGDEYSSYLSPAVSPGGDKLAFCASRRAENTRNVYVMNLDGSEVRKLTNYTDAKVDGATNGVVWAPDGQMLVYSTERGSIHAVDLRGQPVGDVKPAGGWRRVVGMIPVS
ncbi:MAG: GerMN domain-containing protein [Chloroflexota bacterium]